jgi:hypothetical protein
MYYEKYIKFKPKLKKIIKLTKTYKKEERKLKENVEYDTTTFEGVFKFTRYKAKNLKPYIALQEYILSLTVNELMLLRVIMYIGREECGWSEDLGDREKLFDKYFSILNYRFEKKIDKKRVMRSMLSKSPFEDYLGQALSEI